MLVFDLPIHYLLITFEVILRVSPKQRSPSTLLIQDHTKTLSFKKVSKLALGEIHSSVVRMGVRRTDSPNINDGGAEMAIRSPLNDYR